MPGGLGPLNAVDVSSALNDNQYLSPYLPRLLSKSMGTPFRLSYPPKVTPNSTSSLRDPPGIAPELQEMFMRKFVRLVSTFVPAGKRRGAFPDKQAKCTYRTRG